MNASQSSKRTLRFVSMVVFLTFVCSANVVLSDDPKDASVVVVREQLSLGASGSLVETLQRTLNARLVPSPQLSIDGDFGPNTQAAVIRFQRSHKLEASGVVSQTTWDALGTLIEKDDPVADPSVVNAEVLPTQPADPLDGPPYVTCKAWVIADGESGKVLWQHRASKPLPMASTTKIMTAVVILRLAESDPSILDERVTFSERADNTIGSTCRVRAGESLSAGELLYGLMLPSGNDASVALAEHFGDRVAPADSVELDAYSKFVQAMNEEASRLGLEASAFKNPNGLTEEAHHASASDLAKLAHHALQDSRFRRIVSTRQRGCAVVNSEGATRNLIWKNTNRLLGIDGFDGVKTGTTSAAGACLVSRGSRDGKSLIVVVLGSATSDARYVDVKNLYRFGFTKQGTEVIPGAGSR